MDKVIYAVKRYIKSVGILYTPGTLISEQDFWDPSKLRLGKVKVSEGFLIPFRENDKDVVAKAQSLEAQLGMEGLADRILEKLFAETPVEVPQEQNQEVKPTPATKPTEKPISVQSKAPIATPKPTVKTTTPGTTQPKAAVKPAVKPVVKSTVK